MRAISSFLTCTIMLLLSSLATAQDAVPWARSLEEAQQIAGQRGQLILLHFYGDNCPPCRALEANVFPKADFARGLTANYVPVKINASQSRELAARYGVDRWPVDVVVTADGTPLTKPTVSPQDSNKFLANLDQIAALHRVRMDPGAQVAQNVAYNQPPATTPGAQQIPSGSSSYAASPAYAAAANGYAGDPRNSGAAPVSGELPQQQGYDPRGYQSRDNQPMGVDRRSNFQAVSPVPTNPQAEQARSMYPSMSSQFPSADSPRGMQSESSNAVYGSQGQGTAASADPRREVRLGDSQYMAGGSAPVVQPGVRPGQATVPANPYATGNVKLGTDGVAAPMRNDSPVAAGNPPLGLEGFCPVALTDAAKWVKGDARFGAIHRGRTYLFATQADQQRFMANPDKYSPMLSGYDSVKYIEQGVLAEGKRQHGIVHEGQMYLFADEAALDKFCKSPNNYCQPVRQAMQQSITPSAYR